MLLLIISILSAATVSQNSFIVIAQPVTLEDIIEEINTLNDRLDDTDVTISAMNSTLNSLNNALSNLQSTLDSLSATTAIITEVAILFSALDELNDMTIDLQSRLASFNATASQSNLTYIRSTVDELSTTLNELENNLNSLRDSSITPEELDAATSEMNETISFEHSGDCSHRFGSYISRCRNSCSLLFEKTSQDSQLGCGQNFIPFPFFIFKNSQ